MVLLGAAVAAAFVLYLWLMAHWFGRVLAFLAFAVMFAFAGMVIQSSNGSLAGELAALIGGPVLAWFVASVPAWLYARRARLPVYYAPPGRSLTLR